VEVWQYFPQNNVAESLEWLTSIIACNSAEYRMCMRRYPRQGFSLEYQFTETDYALACAKMRLIGENELYVPEWPRIQTIPPVNSGTVTLPFDAAHTPSIKVNGHVLIVETNSLFEVCTVASVGEGTIGVSALANSYTRAVVVPLRVTTFVQPFTGTRASGHYVTAKASFTVTETESGVDATATALPTYLAKPLLLLARELINGSEDTVEREVEVFDSQTGGIINYAIRSFACTGMQLAITAQTQQEQINARSLFASLRGKWKAFWLPSNNADFVLTKALVAGEDFIQIVDVDFVANYGLNTDVAVLLTSGTAIPFRVASVTTEVAGSERLHFASGVLASDVALALVDKVCKLTYSRLDADRIELQYLPGLSFTVVVPTQEIPLP
jgi:hypothetical protein